MILDLVIILLLVSAVFRGREIGFVQQLFSTVGFFGGLVLGALLQPHTVRFVQSQNARLLITLVTTLGVAFLLLAVGESLGIMLKRRLISNKNHEYNNVDNGLGSLLSVLSILVAVWLSAGVIRSLPFEGLQQQLRDSKIASTLSRNLPYAPNVIASVGRLIDPNGFPQVFTGNEPNPPEHINIPSSSELASAVTKDRESVVKIIGQGCGGVVDGSGFVAGDGLVITNAHVVAGIHKQYITDSNGTHSASAIWFDPNLDIAVLRTTNLAGAALPIAQQIASKGSKAAVLGYPGGGGFTANPAAVIDQFTATGRNIYGQGTTNRSIYEIASDVEPGNSGGPLVSADGSVVGVVFAKSTSYNQVGYALTMAKVVNALAKANARDANVSTGSCAE